METNNRIDNNIEHNKEFYSRKDNKRKSFAWKNFIVFSEGPPLIFKMWEGPLN